MKRVLASVICTTLGLWASGVSAQSLTASNTNAVINTNDQPSTITFTSNNTAGFDLTLTYNSALVSIATADITTTLPGTACNVPTAGTILCFGNAVTGALPNGTITLPFDIGGTTGTSPLTFTGSNFSDTAGTPQTGTTTNGSIVIGNAPPTPTAPTIALTPDPANIPAGAVNTTGTTTVTIDTPTDGTNGGNATVTCSIAGGPAGNAFTATNVTGNPFTSGTGTVTVGCTRTAAAASATLTCTATAGGGAPAGTTQDTATVNCPAGTVAPEFSAPLTATLFGAPGGTATGSIAISNTGTGPLTITCGAPSAGFTVTQQPAASVAGGGNTAIGLSCVTPAAAGQTTGTLVCTTNDSDEGTVTFALTCVAQAVSVPTMGTFAKGMLAAMLAAVGLLGFALRRKLV